MDEPCSALDPIATEHRGADAISSRRLTIVIVTAQHAAGRARGRPPGFMLRGELVEIGPTHVIFTAPSDSRTEEYVTGKFG